MRHKADLHPEQLHASLGPDLFLDNRDTLSGHASSSPSPLIPRVCCLEPTLSSAPAASERGQHYERRRRRESERFRSSPHDVWIWIRRIYTRIYTRIRPTAGHVRVQRRGPHFFPRTQAVGEEEGAAAVAGGPSGWPFATMSAIDMT